MKRDEKGRDRGMEVDMERMSRVWVQGELVARGCGRRVRHVSQARFKLGEVDK